MTMFNGMKKAMLAICSALLLAQPAFALDVAGVKVDETVKAGNVDLKLNGAGVRYKAIFKVYVAAMYLPEKKDNLPEILALNGPRRITLTMLREVTSEAFGQSFMEGLNKNSSKAEKAKIVQQMLKFGEMFAAIPELKKGDVVTVEWVPNVGSICTMNGKRVAEPFPDIAFFNALMKIWLGDNPADANLKRALLGERTDGPARGNKEN